MSRFKPIQPDGLINTEPLPFSEKQSQKKITKVSFKNHEIFVEIARTDEEKAKGLSGRKNLGENEGMLFIFEQKYLPSFWMIDMNFPIDIIWISDNEIVDIDKNIPNPEPGTPTSKLPLYTPNIPVNYVLEVNAGFSDKYGIKVGDSVNITF